MAIGDIHAPFAHPDAIPFLVAKRDQIKPTKVVLMGDETDQHALSDWNHDPSGRSPGDEHALALEWLHEFYPHFPEAYVCESNHTSRVYKRGYKSGIPETFFRDYAEILEAPSTWYWADKWVFDDIEYVHGESFGGQLGAFRTAMASHRSCVVGHTHSHAGILYTSQGPGDNMFGLNVGCVIDAHAYAFAYAKHIKARPWIGCGEIRYGVPSLHPMKCDRDGRWTGEL